MTFNPIHVLLSLTLGQVYTFILCQSVVILPHLNVLGEKMISWSNLTADSFIQEVTEFLTNNRFGEDCVDQAFKVCVYAMYPRLTQGWLLSMPHDH